MPRKEIYYCHNELAGCVSQRRNRQSGTLIGVYHNEQAGLDFENGKWSTVCEDHGTICNHDTLALAKTHSSYPAWCEECCDKLQ